MSRLHLRALSAPLAAPTPEAASAPLFFLARTNGAATPVCAGPYATRAEAEIAAKAMKAEFLSSRILIVKALAEVEPVADPLTIVEL